MNDDRKISMITSDKWLHQAVSEAGSIVETRVFDNLHPIIHVGLRRG
jgi:hypothetical protein